MNLYIFRHNGETVKEEIEMIWTDGEKLTKKIVGNIYNLVDFLNYKAPDNSKVKFSNFTVNKLEFIIKSVTKYRDVTIVDEYCSIVLGKVKNKQRGK